MSLHLYWGETHHNTYQQEDQEPGMPDILQTASGHLDFYAAAYYMASQHFQPFREDLSWDAAGRTKGHPMEQLAAAAGPGQGLRYEAEKPLEQLQKEWAEVEAATREAYRPGAFVTFPGFEWQGDTCWGDHNVFYREEGNPILNVPTLPELYAALRGRDGLAIPHHTAYRPGVRAPRWKYFDENLSPFVEIYSIHGCSEYDGHPENLRSNSHMGPGVGGSTYADLLERGAHAGIIGGTDNWTDSPGRWGHGLMGCWAEDLTREGLWDAFRKRCVYGVTGDRIELMLTGNGEPMGSCQPAAEERHIAIRGRACDTVDRIEILKNNRVVHIENPQSGTVRADGRGTYLFRIEMGWGPMAGEFPLPPKEWEGMLRILNGNLRSWKPCWINTDQKPPVVEGDTARFRLVSHQADTPEDYQGGFIFELEGESGTELELTLNGRTERFRLEKLAERSRVHAYEDEIEAILLSVTGREKPYWARINTPHIYAYKHRLHRLIPEAEYAFEVDWTDTAPLERETHYRARIFQRNGQMAWSSPIWFQ